MRPPDTPAPAGLDPATLTLHLVATGLVRALRRAERDDTYFPYDRALQTGLNRLTLAAIEAKNTAPAGIPDLLAWCHRPLGAWGLPLPDGLAGETLLDKGTPTPFCDEMACLMPDAEADLTEQHLLQAVLAACEEGNTPGTYVAFRALLIEKPALSQLEFLERTGAPLFDRVRGWLDEAYEEVPAALVTRDGTVMTCAGCGNVLVPQQDDTLRCEEAECERGAAVRVGVVYPVAHRPLRLKRGLRLFVAGPGRAETRLAGVLQKRGVSVEMWPACDRYDLRLSFADGTIWAVDVKDWHNPYLLARKLAPVASLPASPPWQRGFFVFPDRRKRDWPDYKRVIENRCMVAPNVALCFEREFLRQVNKKIKETGG